MQIFQAQDGQRGLGGGVPPGAGLRRDPEAEHGRPRSPRSAQARRSAGGQGVGLLCAEGALVVSRKAAVGKLPGVLPSPVWLSLTGAGG